MDERPGFLHGVFAGYAGFVVLAQLVLGAAFPDLRAMYHDMAPDIRLPLLTRITIHPAWLWGAPAVGVALIAGLLVKRPRSLAAYIAVAVVLTVVAFLTWWYPRAPIFALAGNIKAD